MKNTCHIIDTPDEEVEFLDIMKYFFKGIFMVLLAPIGIVICTVLFLADFARNPYEDYSQQWFDREEKLRLKKEKK